MIKQITNVNFNSFSVIRKVLCHGIVEVGLVGVLVHVPDGVVVRLDLRHAVHAEAERGQSQSDEDKLEKKKKCF